VISHPHRCLSVHIPKTGGNSINRIFGIGWQNHKDLARYREELGVERFRAYFKFAVVRNPWERLLSDYNYQVRKSRPGSVRLLVHDAAGRRRGFAAWARAALGSGGDCRPRDWGAEVSPGIHRFSPQVEWLTLEGQLGVDAVARLETIDADLALILRRIGLPIRRLPRRNRRFHLHYAWYYDPPTRDLVARYYADDVAAFGYRFEPGPLCAWWLRWQSRHAAA
jgi:hypothetical protein